MSLSEINKREKDFHNNLQKKEGRKFESNFYKAIKNMFDDFHAKIKENSFQNNILDFGCGIGKNLETVVNLIQKKLQLSIFQMFKLKRQKKILKISTQKLYSKRVIVSSLVLKVKNLT